MAQTSESDVGLLLCFSDQREEKMASAIEFEAVSMRCGIEKIATSSSSPGQDSLAKKGA